MLGHQLTWGWQSWGKIWKVSALVRLASQSEMMLSQSDVLVQISAGQHSFRKCLGSHQSWYETSLCDCSTRSKHWSSAEHNFLFPNQVICFTTRSCTGLNYNYFYLGKTPICWRKGEGPVQLNWGYEKILKQMDKWISELHCKMLGIYLIWSGILYSWQFFFHSGGEFVTEWWK